MPEIESQITGWQERFPLPDAICNPEFRNWVQDLDGKSQLQLEEEMMGWFIENKRSERLFGNEMFKDNFDTFIGNLVKAKGDNSEYTRGLPPRYHGTLLRMLSEVIKERHSGTTD